MVLLIKIRGKCEHILCHKEISFKLQEVFTKETIRKILLEEFKCFTYFFHFRKMIRSLRRKLKALETK